MPRAVVISSSAARRQQHAARWLEGAPSEVEQLLVGAGLDGAADLARRELGRRGALFGWHRLSFRRLVLRLADPALVERRLAPASGLALEALWARVVHELHLAGRLGRFEPLAGQPGLPRALRRTVEELRQAQLAPADLDADLATAAGAYLEALRVAELVDRPGLLALALEQVRQGGHPLVGLRALWLDVPLATRLERELVACLAERAPDVLATVPRGDERTLQLLESALGVRATSSEGPAERGLDRLQQQLFSSAPPPEAAESGDVELLSAPGEMRECVELVRVLHREVARGTPLDRIAVLLRAPAAYRSPLCEALRRGDVPAHFVQGTRQPDPAGRALLALLACADERLSAQRFSEYLSLGEVPRATAEGEPPPAAEPSERVASVDEEALDDGLLLTLPEPERAPEPEDFEEEPTPVVAGGLRAPRRWERLIVEAAVIGGSDRWRKRLTALERSYLRELAVPDLSEANTARLTRNLADLHALTTYALPLIDLLATWPREAVWTEWLERLSVLSTRALRHPSRVLGVLAELAPLGSVGPVSLAEVREVLSERLRELTVPPLKRRFGRVFVAPVEAARGMAFDVVLVPGLAERIFPQKVREDPLLPDRERLALSEDLERDAARVGTERLQLQLAVGAARERVVLSFPRIDTSDARPRVPSFYALEAVRAVEGVLPRYEALRRRAERAVDARIGWPAPRDPSTAIDLAERDLSTLDALFRGPQPLPRGAARYLTQVNASLARGLRRRYSRWHGAWSQADGLVKPSPEALAALEAHQLSARPYSATALQNFSACPYRFYLSALLRLAPREDPLPLEELDPLQRGSMVHEVHYGLLSLLREEGRLPVRPDGLEHALDRIDEVLAEVATKYEELYAPAIDRVWQDALVAIRADVREWVRRVAAQAAGWEPWKFELAFGLGLREQQDPDSRGAPVELEGGLRLRGSIDLVERSAGGALRATDYKTGKARAKPGTVLGGGRVLQPTLYALALEKLFPGASISGGRLAYCTQAGGFTDVDIPLDATSREAARRAIGVVHEALEKGFLPAAPAKDECTYCDYRRVCGPSEERRLALKPRAALQSLQALRELK